MELVLYLTIILVATKIAGDISVKLGQPSVLGKLVIGIFLGPSVFGLITETQTLEEMSQVGVILLMFIAGLETDIHEFKRTGKAATMVGFGGIIVPLVVGFMAGNIMHLTTIGSWFLGLLLSATSVSISVQTLKELNLLKTREGSTILGAAVIDDVVVIIALAFLMSFVGESVNLGLDIFKKSIFFVGIYFLSRYLIPIFMKKFSSLKVTETVISSALVICFSFAYLAEFLGVAAIIGAYIAGIAISRTRFKQEVFEKVETITYAIFAPIFFASIGAAADFTGLAHNFGLILLLSLLAMITKLIGAAIGAKLSGFKNRSALGIGGAMIARGEVALIMAKIGLEKKLLSEDLFAVLIVVVLATTLITPPLIKIVLGSKDGDKAISESTNS